MSPEDIVIKFPLYGYLIGLRGHDSDSEQEKKDWAQDTCQNTVNIRNETPRIG